MSGQFLVPEGVPVRSLSRSAGLAAALLLSVGLLTSCGDDTSDDAASDRAAMTAPELEVSATDGWVRATKGTEDTSMTAAFMQLQNDGDEAVVLTGASSPVAGMTQIHEMATVDGEMVMRQIEGGLEIPAGRGQLLMPGGNHVMLMDLDDELAPGDEVEVTLEFEGGETMTMTLPVKEFTEEEPHYHEDGSDHGDGETVDPMDGMDGTDGSGDGEMG